jgi:hypothetical protein
MAIQSLFGTSPEEVILARQKEARQEQLLRNQQIAQQGSQFGVFAPLYQAGLRFGDIAGQAVSQGLFPGSADPILKKAVDVQSVLSRYQGQDLSDPTVLKGMSGELSKLGYANEAMMLSKEATTAERLARAEKREETKLDIQLAELGIKRRTLTRQEEKDERDLVEFFKKNPEQSGTALQTLAAQIERDPTNQVLLDRYNKIAQAGTSGAMEVSAKAEKTAIETEKDRVLIARYRQELDDTRKLKPADRYDAEIDAARDLLKNYKIDITKPLEGQVSAQVLYGPIAGELTNAYERALRRKTTEMGGAPAPVPGATPGPVAAPTSGASRVIDFNALPK